MNYNISGEYNMAKRKRRKKDNSENRSSLSVDITGLILILVGIIGMGFGIVGNFIKKFAMFLGGELWYLLLFLVLILGTYMLVKRKTPKFFSIKLIGLYLVLLVILGITHFGILKDTKGFQDVLDTTYESYNERIASLDDENFECQEILCSGDNEDFIGGGFTGAVVVGTFDSLFDNTGTLVVLIVLGCFGLILLFNVTIAELWAKLINKLHSDNDEDDEKGKEKDNKKKKEYIIEGDELVGVKDKEDVEPAPEEKKKIVVTSIDELKSISNANNTPLVPEVTKDSFDPDNKGGEIEAPNYHLPKFDLLKPAVKNKTNNEEAYIKGKIETLERVLNDFDIKGKVVEIHVGPAVTEYEITVPAGTKVNKIVNINKEIALALAAKDIRIQAPIPGKSTIGVEIPNREIAAVSIREVLENTINTPSQNKILVALGKDIMGKSILADLAKMPHLLVAGSTGSGKSVCINSIICSILMRYKPNEVKLVLVDPKKVELSNYNGTPHLLCPVVTDPKKASATLQKIVTEMETRYELFEEKGVKNIAGYNEWVAKESKKNPDSPINIMAYIVVIIDELADLMLVASKEVQDSIMRITQMARAAGIHLIVATQRPSTDIITGVIKNNIPSRISFAVTSQIDSRTILDQAGAEKLLGRGDMLYLPMGDNTTTRIQGCYISDEEINKLIQYCQTQATAKYNEVFTSDDIHSEASGSTNSDGCDEPMYDEVVKFAVETGKISASLIQRRFRFGYNRAARIIDLLESRGIVGPQNGSKPREVLVKMESADHHENEES